MSKEQDKKNVYNQMAWILNYQPTIKEQHIHMGVQSQDNVGEEESEVIGEEQRVRKSIDVLKKEKLLKNAYDYTWIMEVMNQTEDLPNFSTPHSFIVYMKGLGIIDLPSESSINKKQNVFTGTFPQWEFTDCDTTEATRRINVAKRFLSAYRKCND